jgi:hypothetical protein
LMPPVMPKRRNKRLKEDFTARTAMLSSRAISALPQPCKSSSTICRSRGQSRTVCSFIGWSLSFFLHAGSSAARRFLLKRCRPTRVMKSLVLLRNRSCHRRRRAHTLLSAGIYRSRFIVVGLAGHDGTIGKCGVRVRSEVNLGKRAGRAAAAVNVVASHAAAGIPSQADGVHRRCAYPGE